MPKVSLTYVGVAVGALSYLANLLNVNVAPGDVDTTVVTIVALVSAVLAFYGRWRKGGVNLFGVKR